LDEKRRKKFFAHGVAPIELDAVYDTTCKKCGGKGLFMLSQWTAFTDYGLINGFSVLVAFCYPFSLVRAVD